MPQIDMENWNIASENRKNPENGQKITVIEGNSVDITDRQDIDEDTADLASEPEFPVDNTRFREPNALETLAARIPYGPIRSLNPELLHSKWRLFEQLTPTIPLNEYGLPIYIYRPDMLDHAKIQQDLLALKGTVSGEVPTTPSLSVSPGTRDAGPSNASPTNSGLPSTLSYQAIQGDLDAALMQLSYHEGFPATPEGFPLWRQLPFEHESAYDAFVAYLEMGGARKISDLIAYPLEEVREWFHLCYWQVRVKAFELYRVVHAQKIKLNRMLDVEDDNYKQASKLMTKITTAFDKIKTEELEEIGLTKLVDIFEKLVKVQRISVGLNANGGAVDEMDLRRAPTTINVMQSVAAGTPQTHKQAQDDVNILEEAPDAIDAAQDLIIKVQKARGGAA